MQIKAARQKRHNEGCCTLKIVIPKMTTKISIPRTITTQLEDLISSYSRDVRHELNQQFKVENVRPTQSLSLTLNQSLLQSSGDLLDLMNGALDPLKKHVRHVYSERGRECITEEDCSGQKSDNEFLRGDVTQAQRQCEGQFSSLQSKPRGKATNNSIL